MPTQNNLETLLADLAKSLEAFAPLINPSSAFQVVTVTVQPYDKDCPFLFYMTDIDLHSAHQKIDIFGVRETVRPKAMRVARAISQMAPCLSSFKEVALRVHYHHNHQQNNHVGVVRGNISVEGYRQFFEKMDVNIPSICAMIDAVADIPKGNIRFVETASNNTIWAQNEADAVRLHNAFALHLRKGDMAPASTLYPVPNTAS